MKKLLALVLALVMTLSLCITSNAAFDDAADVNYDEAVGVMSLVGVLKGYEDGSFQPTKTVTRAEAAKIITYLAIGEKAAEALTKDVTAFSDVAAGNWAAGYITYCYNAGIIGGMGDGKFVPSEKVTALQFAKMLLVVLGYNAADEGLVGSDWALATAKLAAKKNLFKGNSNLAANNAATREEAALYAFNALNAYTVTPGSGNVSVKGEGVEVTIGGAPATDNPTLLKDELYKTDLGAPALNKTIAQDDEFDRPSVKWALKEADGSQKASKVLTYAEKADKVFTSAVTRKTMLSELKGLKLNAATPLKISATTGTSTVTVVTDGVPAGSAITIGTNTDWAGAIAALTGAGVQVELFVDDNDVITDIVVVNTYIGKVTKVTAATAYDKRNVTVAGMTFDTESFAKGDYVTYTKAAGEIQTMEAAKVVTGTLTKIENSKKYTVDGVVYEQYNNASGALAASNLDKEVSFYVDSFNNILLVKEAAAAAKQYVYVLANKAGTQDYITSGNHVADFYGVLSNGEVVNGKVEKSGTININDYADKLCSYKVNSSSGNYELTVVDAAADSTNDVANKATSLPSAQGILNANTVFVFVEIKGSGNKTVKNVAVKTGNDQLGTGIDASETPYYVAAENGVAKVVFVTGAFVSASENTDDLVYVDISTESTSVTKTTDGDTTVYSYKAYDISGDELTVTSKDQVTSNDKIFVRNEDNSITKEETSYTGTVTAIDANTITIYNGSYAYYTFDKADASFNGDVDDTELLVGQTVRFVKNSDNTSKIDALWVTVDQVMVTLTVTGAEADTNDLIKGANVANTVKLTVDVSGATVGQKIQVTNATASAGDLDASNKTAALTATQIAAGTLTITVKYSATANVSSVVSIGA